MRNCSPFSFTQILNWARQKYLFWFYVSIYARTQKIISISTRIYWPSKHFKYNQVYFSLFHWLSREGEFDYLTADTCEKNAAEEEETHIS